MELTMLVFRVVHVVCGVFWAGAIFYFVTLASPAIRDAGPEGSKVMQALIRRRQLEILPVLAGLTIVSGLWLLWRVSAGFQSEWFGTPAAHSLLLGMVTSLVAFGLGFFGMRPAVLRAGATVQAALQGPAGAERQAKLAEAQALQARARNMGRAVAALLLVAVVTMAIARYV